MYKVIWDDEAKMSLKEIISYIRKQSPNAADKVKQGIIRLASSLNKFPERFSKEEYLQNKDGNYRSVSIWSYKLVYKIEDETVMILFIMHNSQNPAIIEELE